MTTSLIELQERLGYTFRDPALLERSLTHKSHYFENRQDSLGHNERLEFLGDAVIDLAVGALLMESFPEDEEGLLSKKRAYLVSEKGLAEVAQDIGLPGMLRLGKGEIEAGGAEKPRILSGCLEAVVGAMFLESDYTRCAQQISQLFGDRLTKVDVNDVHDAKSKFQELVQEKRKTTPNYKVLEESGPDHQKSFEVGVYVQGQLIAQGSGRSKRVAEHEAARLAWQKWSEL